jgi:5-methylcytosine-specific restriction endonuclease McrA
MLKERSTREKSCTKCGVKFPYTEEYFYRKGTLKNGKPKLRSDCKICFAKLQKEIYDANTEFKRKEALSYYYKNNYYNRNKEQIKEKVKQRTKNSEEYKLSKKISKRRRKLKSHGLKYTIQDWHKCLSAFNNKCAYCGSKADLTMDHFKPVHRNGEYSVNNIIPACVRCNCSKSTKSFFEWYPQQTFYSKRRENKILKYLNYDSETKVQQLSICI